MLKRATLVTDRDHESAESTRAAVGAYLPALAGLDWTTITVDADATVGAVAKEVETSQPDLIVAFRHLGESSLVPQHSLGVHLDVLTQVASQPVLVLPGTAAERAELPSRATTGMVVTDHIRGERRLISTAAGLLSPGSTLWLCHVEDEAVLERYLRLIGQIPELDTDVAAAKLPSLLQAEASDYLAAAVAGLQEAGLELTVETLVTQGHRFREFRGLVEHHAVDLLVLNTKNDDQLAMDGMAYALAVELIQTPLLLL